MEAPPSNLDQWVAGIVPSRNVAISLAGEFSHESFDLRQTRGFIAPRLMVVCENPSHALLG